MYRYLTTCNMLIYVVNIQSGQYTQNNTKTSYDNIIISISLFHHTIVMYPLPSGNIVDEHIKINLMDF